jgi:S-disulfanyl-L-cysteine oxidoreductase SoxD
MRKLLWLLLLLACPSQAAHFGLGSPPDAALLRAWDIDIGPDGVGLPPGSGSVSEGRRIYAERCSACHGSEGQGGPMDRLVGGEGTLASTKPVKTVGSFWPYATTLFDYVRRAMPFDAPQSLTPEEVYSVSAFILYLNGIVAEDAVLDAKTLALVRMPNRDGFVPDPRPDTGR